MEFTDRRGQMRSRRVLLADGGKFDNLGITCLEPGASVSIGYNHFAQEYIICCDAGHRLFRDYPVPYPWGPRMLRSFQSVFRKAQNTIQDRLHLLAATSQIHGFLLPYPGQIDNRLPYAPIDLVSREAVYEYPPDFGPMS
jgi:NTE family protein